MKAGGTLDNAETDVDGDDEEDGAVGGMTDSRKPKVTVVVFKEI